MARVKSTSARRHRKVLSLARGYRQARRRRYQTAQEAVIHAGAYAYIGRKDKKGDFRQLWITRIKAASLALGLSYSKLIKILKDAHIELDRKILSEIAATDEKTFAKIVESANKK